MGIGWSQDPRNGWYPGAEVGSYQPTIKFEGDASVPTGAGSDTVIGVAEIIGDDFLAYAVTLGVVTLSTAGVYRVTGNWVFPSNATGTFRFGRVVNNSSAELMRDVSPPASGISSGGSADDVVELESGDQIYIGARHDAGVNLTVVGRLALTLLKPAA